MLENLGAEITVAATIISALAAVLAVLVAWWVHRSQITEEKRRTAVDLYQEFDSPEMLRARVDAAKFIRENYAERTLINIRDFYTSTDDRVRDRFLPLSRVLHFWERLCHLLDAEMVDRKIARAVFYRDYSFWQT